MTRCQYPSHMVAIISRLSLLSASVAFTLSACGPGTYSHGFEAEAAAMVRPPVTAEGPWLGSWQSEVNGHHGPLWCIVRPTPGRCGNYDFRYRAGWGVFRFGDYTHTTPACVADSGSLALAGAMALPGRLGTYQVKGLLTRNSFDATYRSAADHGTLTLRRPAASQKGISTLSRRLRRARAKSVPYLANERQSQGGSRCPRAGARRPVLAGENREICRLAANLYQNESGLLKGDSCGGCDS